MVELLVFLMEHNKTTDILQALKKFFKYSLLFKLQKYLHMHEKVIYYWRYLHLIVISKRVLFHFASSSWTERFSTTWSLDPQVHTAYN